MTTGLAVEYAELHALAAALRWQAGQLSDEALLLTRSAASADIAQAVVLAPAEAAHAEATILAAATHADLLLVELEAFALATGAAAEIYRLADEAVALGEETATEVRREAEVAWRVTTTWAYDEAYPFLLDAGIDGTILAAQLAALRFGGVPVLLLTGGHWPTTSHEEAAAGLIALLEHLGIDADPELRPPSLHPSARYPAGTRVDLEALMNFEGDSYNKHDGQARPQVVITKVKGADGTERWIVNIPGTEPSRPLGPTGFDTDVATLAAATSRGEQAELSRAIVAAMDAAGVDDSGLDVMLSGHSLGGMVAADIASDPSLVRAFHITAITTQGSPIAHYPVDASVEVLAFEHDQDPIPQLDGANNPHRDGWTTVSVTSPTRSLDPMGPHGQDQYMTTMAGTPDQHGQRSGGYAVAPDSAVHAFLGTVESQQTSRLEEK
jgi:hypothetical protein